MIVFELSMPNVGSWNGRWSGEGRCYARVMRDKSVPKELWNRSFYYNWGDGWGACVSVDKVDYKEAKRIKRISNGFLGYDWMIDGIIAHGEIRKPTE